MVAVAAAATAAVHTVGGRSSRITKPSNFLKPALKKSRLFFVLRGALIRFLFATTRVSRSGYIVQRRAQPHQVNSF
jgi:hypothetical protein